jgi:protein-tyrosine phosphatase
MIPNKTRVLFVCAGNICRSPLAEGIFLDLVAQKGLAQQFEIDSAGTGAWHTGERPDPRSIAVAREHGFELPGMARQVKANDFVTFDHILCMDLANQSELLRIAPNELQPKIRLIREFDSTAAPKAEVPDPYYGAESGFENVYQMLVRACSGLLNQLHSDLSAAAFR